MPKTPRHAPCKKRKTQGTGRMCSALCKSCVVAAKQEALGSAGEQNVALDDGVETGIIAVLRRPTFCPENGANSRDSSHKLGKGWDRKGARQYSKNNVALCG